MELEQIITLLIATWGAILSTLLAYKTYRDDTRICHTTINRVAGIYYGIDGPERKVNDVIIGNVANTSKRPVVIESAILFNKKLGSLIPIHSPTHKPFQSSNLPCKLEDGDKFSSWFPYSQIVKFFTDKNLYGKQKVRFIFSDTSGKIYKSKNLKLEIEKT